MLSLKTIDINTPDSDWQLYFELLVRMKTKYGCTLRSDSWQEFKKKLVSHFEVCKEPFLEAVISDDEKFLAWMVFIVNNTGTKDQDVIIVFDFDESSASPPIAKLIAKQYLDWMDEFNTPEAVVMAENERVADASELIGGEILQEFSEYILPREKVNHKLIANWIKSTELENRDLRIEMCNEITDDLLDRYCELHSVFLADMPEVIKTNRTYKYTSKRYKDRKKWRLLNDVRVYHSLLFDNSNNLIGFSAAEINTKKQNEIYQYMTGVDRDYRGRSLSRWLKASLMKIVETDFPEYGYFQTMMRTVNEPIQQINKELGYEFLQKGWELKITPKKLENYLK